MEPVVVDTDVASYRFKEDTRAEYYRPALAGRLKFVSFMTQAELYLWSEKARWGGARHARLEAFLRGFIVVPYDSGLCREWARVIDAARRAGRPIGVADAWIATTALAYGLQLATNNPSDYAGVHDLRLFTA